MPNGVAETKLAECSVLVSRLHKMCCDPDRSPRMGAIEADLAAIRVDVDDGSTEALQRAMTRLEDLGSQLGWLQVACCAPPRMPLYAEALLQLNQVRNDLAGQLGVAH